METSVRNIQNYIDYTMCGEILRPPSGNYQRPYVLKCFNCQETYLLFEAFIFHIEDHCKKLVGETKTNSGYTSEINDNSNNDGYMELADKNAENIIKVEETCLSILKEDPLIAVKPENLFEYEEFLPEKEETKSTDCNVNNASKNDEENLRTLEEICKTDSIENLGNSDKEEENVTTVEEIFETDTIENLGNSGEDDYESSDEEIENSLGHVTRDMDDVYELKIAKQPRSDLDSSLRTPGFIKDLLKSKNYVISFIEAYKNQPSLWNKNFPFLRQKEKRQNCLQQIADDVKKQHDLTITCDQVADFAVYLRRKYREDLKGTKEAKEGEGNCIPSWFFKNLNFLKPFMEKNQMAKLDSHIPDLLPNQIIEILEIYKGFPHIWNTEMIEHYCKNKVDAAKQEMLEAIKKKLAIRVSENVLENYFRTTNKYFSRAKRKLLDTKSNKTNSDINSEDCIQEDYYEHMLFLNDHVGSFICSECNRSFKSPLYLKIHKTNAHGFEPLPCSQCHKPFRSVIAYRYHVKRHMEDLNHECKECGKKFLNSTKLRIHMRNHTGVKPFCCEKCGASFRHSQGFNDHYRRHLKNYLHNCEKCGKGFYSKDSYNDHMNSHSNTRNQVCKVCSKTFISRRTLQQHVVIHDEVRRHACKLCGKTFKQQTGVSQHMKTHAIANSEDNITFT